VRAITVHAFGAPEEMRLTDAPALMPGAESMLIEVKAAGVNPVDTYIRAGTHAIHPSLPYTPGFDGAGIVTQGPAAAVRPGDRVYFNGSISGSYAQMALCRVDQVRALPDQITFAQGCRARHPVRHGVPRAVRARSGHEW
jgi:NADPH2:quinone reductase